MKVVDSALDYFHQVAVSITIDDDATNFECLIFNATLVFTRDVFKKYGKIK
ncbi:hypothetical protein [cyanobacterium endosymbiont of Epithemia turgida]|uniref:hypothetical protein n=1 Tax=cyanobacterium endosymbiont of Epithemia turgida TaxID=718217 RepID=UPI0014940CD7|nr:hypothetical protein [cyanobacterium endosymbiont of Epithemia turgida]